MSDPAVEAARRAWDGQMAADAHGIANGYVAAAREALKPIRELHKPFVVRTPDDETWHECETCHGIEWPCATARLIYTSEELS